MPLLVVGTAVGTSTITVPTGVITGDLIRITAAVPTDDIHAIDVPTGWSHGNGNTTDSMADGGIACVWGEKVSDGTEGGTTVSPVWAGPGTPVCAIAVYRGVTAEVSDQIGPSIDSTGAVATVQSPTPISATSTGWVWSVFMATEPFTTSTTQDVVAGMGPCVGMTHLPYLGGSQSTTPTATASAPAQWYGHEQVLEGGLPAASPLWAVGHRHG